MGFDEKDLEQVEKIEEGVKEGGTIEVKKKDYWEDEKDIKQLSEISLWLDSYDDIFSDFDPRPYSERSLSDDFLSEAKKASREKKSGKLQLMFLIPKNLRDQGLETVIRKRLREHFRRHAWIVEEDIRKGRRHGLKYISIGVVMMLVASYLMLIEPRTFLLNLLTVVLEPCGWFFAWTGLDQALVSYRQKKPDLEFNEKMSKSEISFHPY